MKNWLKMESATDRTSQPWKRRSWQEWSILPSDLKRKVDYTKTMYAMKKPAQMITGREIMWRIYDYNKISKAAHVIREFQDFIGLELRGENLSQFMSAWDKNLLTMTNLPTENIMESTN